MKSLPGLILLAAISTLSAKTLSVGPKMTFSLPCDAFGAARDGDVIEIDAAGKYAGDVCSIARNNLTIRGVNGRPIIEAGGRVAEGKGIWVIRGRDTVVENIEFTGATVGERNGAGIRQEGRNLTVRNCYFHHNENGILANPEADSDILVEYSEFGHNGYGDGQSHNLYVGNVRRLIIRFCYFHHANVGHLIKTRAAESIITYNRLTTESNGATSFEIHFAEGARGIVVGNLFEQGPLNDNEHLIAYGLEHPHPNAPEYALYLANNTFVNDDKRSGGSFLLVDERLKPSLVLINNIFVGPGAVLRAGSLAATLKSNWTGGDPQLRSREDYDYRLTAGSPVIDKGTDPGSAGDFPLLPVYQYVHPACGESRKIHGPVDIGAYEYGEASGATPPNLPARCRKPANSVANR